VARREIQREPVGAGQESVWDYPRPPALERSDRHVVMRRGDTVIAETRRPWRVLETSHPPGWYLPREDVAPGVLVPSSAASTVCEWKGRATYWDVVLPEGVLEAAVWSYESPTAPFAALAGAVTGYPALLECLVDGERARPQEGRFYGGWITSDVVGPFKGGPGTLGW
jgi:uncharacterized protein (DUF427 family)